MSDDDENKRLMPALPIEWRTPKAGGKPGEMQTVGRTNAMIAAPTAAEVKSFGDQRRLTCASCKHFRRPNEEKGAKDRPAISNFVARAVLEFGWKTKHLVDKPENLGRCDQNTQLAVGPNSGACDAHKPRPFR